MKKNYPFFLSLVSCFLIVSCNNNEKAVSVPVINSKKPVLMEPFRFHKLIEVSPGQDYDVLSWGRGSSTTGSFEILHSDSAAGKFTTTTGDLDGTIADVYNSDMDLDGNPEILIQVKKKDTVNYTTIYAFEFSNNKAQKLDFPKLTKKERRGYRGEDNFYIEDGKLFREFPIYNGNDKDAKLTGQKRKFEYGLRNNEFTIKQLDQDGSSETPTNQVKASPVKEKKEVEHQKSATKKHKSESHKSEGHHSKKHKAKKHSAESHKKKHRKHHHRSEE